MIEPSLFRCILTLALIRALVIVTLLTGTAVAATVSPGVTDREGIISHDVQSSRQSGPTQIRVLLPDRPKAKRDSVVYVLPVEAGIKMEFGDPLLELKRLDLHNRYNVIFVEPTFFETPWYADNPEDRRIQQEGYLLKDVIPFIDRTYSSRPRADSRFLLGFSKSGWGAWTLLLRHPQIFGRAAAWDAPMMMNHPGAWGSGPIFGTKKNFELYRVTNLLRAHAAELRASTRNPPRLILTGYAVFRNDHERVHALMKELGIPHIYRDGPQLKHDWRSGWVEESVMLLFAPGDRL
jgi:hypothetical protein